MIDEVVKVKPENYVFEKDAVNLARLIINESNDLGIPINNPRLQRLLYLIQSAYLLESKGREGVFDDGLIQAWAFGPVVPEVYSKFILYGESNIPKIENLLIHLPNKELTFRKQKGSDTYFAIERASGLLTEYIPWVNPFSEIDKKIVNKVIYMFKDFSHLRLSEMTRRQIPWKNAWMKGSGSVIYNKNIYLYFKDILNENQT